MATSKHILLSVVSTAALLFAERPLVPIASTSNEVKDADTGIVARIVTPQLVVSPTEVTQAEYESIAGSNPSFYKGVNRPVENVSWWDAIRYANARSIREKLQPVYDLATGRSDRTRNGYRLLSDAEFDAASAGSDPKQSNLGTANTKDPALLLKLMNGTGTRDVASFQPGKLGLYDMIGNVWEWTDDFLNPVANVPKTNAGGLDRIIRGGSFISTVSGWGRGYRSSMPADHKSRFTGFRLCRTVAPAAKPNFATEWSAVYNHPPAGFESGIGNLTALLSPSDTAQTWNQQRETMRAKWQRILGTPSISTPPPIQTRLIETVHDISFEGQLLQLQTEPDSWEKIFVMRPPGNPPQPRPVIIVPYYDVDTPAGRNLGGRSFMTGSVRAYAKLAVERGYIAVAIRWFGESYGERYDEAVANLYLRHPNWTGLGKWVWDSQRLLDYLHTLPDVDRTRIGIIGHSLGAKMALYAAAMDDRIHAVVFSEGGIGFSMSNYDDFWYLGPALKRVPPGTDQHELLALTAPRPFLLIGGDEYDGPKSWHYIHAVRPVYQLFSQPDRIGYFNHHTGHSPTPEAISHAFRWLDRWLVLQ